MDWRVENGRRGGGRGDRVNHVVAIVLNTGFSQVYEYSRGSKLTNYNQIPLLPRQILSLHRQYQFPASSKTQFIPFYHALTILN